jgi:cation transport ATPase
MGAQRLTIPISGLRCAGSECYTLERALRRVPGVVDVYVNPVTEMAYIDYDPPLAGQASVMRRSGPMIVPRTDAGDA